MRLFMLFALIASASAIGCGKKEDPAPKADPLKGIIVGELKPDPPPPPPPPPDILQVKGNEPPKGLVQGVRAASLRPKRLNELRGIATFFQTFELDNNRPPRTDEEFINYIKREANDIAEAIKDKYYILNLKVNMRKASSVVAYESLQDQGGYQTARVDGSVSPVPADELRKLLME